MTVKDVKILIIKYLANNQIIKSINDENAYELKIIDDEDKLTLNYDFELKNDSNFYNLNINLAVLYKYIQAFIENIKFTNY